MKLKAPLELVFFALGLLVLSACAMPQHDAASTGPATQQMSHASMPNHAAHMAMMHKKGYTRNIENYQIPDLQLINQDGERVDLKKLLQSDKPVIVDFIYATCTTICPLLSMGYVDLQRQLGAKSDQVVLISVTIDPEHDTPEVLHRYLHKFHAKPGWTFLTGTRAEVDQVTTAFDAFVADKMDHQPLNFIRMPGQNSWIRLTGMLNGQIFLDEIQKGGITLK